MRAKTSDPMPKVHEGRGDGAGDSADAQARRLDHRLSLDDLPRLNLEVRLSTNADRLRWFEAVERDDAIRRRGKSRYLGDCDNHRWRRHDLRRVFGDDRHLSRRRAARLV